MPFFQKCNLIPVVVLHFAGTSFPELVIYTNNTHLWQSLLICQCSLSCDSRMNDGVFLEKKKISVKTQRERQHTREIDNSYV